MQKYLGNIYVIFSDVLEKVDGFSAGEKLMAIEKVLGKRFIYATDEELYNAMEEYVKSTVETDEVYSEQEFINWVESKF